MPIASRIKIVFVTFLTLQLSCSVLLAFETRARSAFIYDQTTDTVMLAKDADTPLPPASMSKLMTLYVVFEALQDGRLSLDERLPVSEHAMSYRGSTMFLDTTDRVSVSDLIKGVIVLSGNDASAVLAEALSPDGTEAGFAKFMTDRARALGMKNSNFINSNGWPAKGHAMSMRDLATISDHLIENFPEYYALFALREFAFDGRAPRNKTNRNPLLSLGIGADGLKTGHTQEAGYGLVGSAKQGERRIIFVLSGLENAKERAEEAEALVNWAFRQFVMKTAAGPGQRIADAQTWLGDAPTVSLVAKNHIQILTSAIGNASHTAEIVYNGPIEAPIKKGKKLAELVITPKGFPETRHPLVAGEDIAKGGLWVRIMTTAKLLLADVMEF